MGMTLGKCRKEGGGPGNHNYEFDMLILGGGSGGISVAREAAKLGAKVGLCDFVLPSGSGTRWGLGGTCVNVGCIPKKLMHQASIVGDTLIDASSYGWQVSDELPLHSWQKMVANIQLHIKSLNWGYKVVLHQAAVKYFNKYAAFVDNHTLKMTNIEGKVTNRTANYIVIACGGRPRYLDIPGGRKHEFTITSDDIFSLSYHPGKTLVVGGSFVALECASFLAGLGMEVTVMVRSILLRGYDRQLADMMGDAIRERGVNFLYNWEPSEIKKVKDGQPPTLEVTSKKNDGKDVRTDTFNTVLCAIGRDPVTRGLNLENAGVTLNPNSRKIPTNKADQTNVKNIYAIGDVADKRPELTPVAIKAGLMLAKRLFGGSKLLYDYTRVPMTIYATCEYSIVGMDEESAIKKYGQKNIEVYHTSFVPLEWALPQKTETQCYIKLICLKTDKERVIGFHYFGPNAGEVCQGFALAIRLGAKKDDFDAVTGIHPTCAEIFTTMTITKSSGVPAFHSGC